MSQGKGSRSMKRKKTIACVAVGALLMWVAASLAVDKSGTVENVKIDNFSFTPQTVTIRAGTTVTWNNKDDVPHTVVSTTKKFRSGVLDTDGQFSYTFDDAGTYDYFCSIHPHMTGKVIVK